MFSLLLWKLPKKLSDINPEKSIDIFNNTYYQQRKNAA